MRVGPAAHTAIHHSYTLHMHHILRPRQTSMQSGGSLTWPMYVFVSHDMDLCFLGGLPLQRVRTLSQPCRLPAYISAAQGSPPS